MRIKAIIISFFVSFLILMGTCVAEEIRPVTVEFDANVTVIPECKPSGTFDIDFGYEPFLEPGVHNIRIIYISGSTTEGSWITETYPGNYSLDTKGQFEPGTFKEAIVIDNEKVIMVRKGYLRHDELGEYVIKTYNIHPDSPGLKKYLELYGVGN